MEKEAEGKPYLYLNTRIANYFQIFVTIAIVVE